MHLIVIREQPTGGKTPPVAISQKASDCHVDKLETLSKASTCALFAEMKRSRILPGSVRSGVVFGSSNSRRIREIVDFEDPCSPVSTSTG